MIADVESFACSWETGQSKGVKQHDGGNTIMEMIDRDLPSQSANDIPETELNTPVYQKPSPSGNQISVTLQTLCTPHAETDINMTTIEVK